MDYSHLSFVLLISLQLFQSETKLSNTSLWINYELLMLSGTQYVLSTFLFHPQILLQKQTLLSLSLHSFYTKNLLQCRNQTDLYCSFLQELCCKFGKVVSHLGAYFRWVLLHYETTISLNQITQPIKLQFSLMLVLLSLLIDPKWKFLIIGWDIFKWVILQSSLVFDFKEVLFHF